MRRDSARATRLAATALAVLACALSARAWMRVNIPGAPGGRQWVLEDFRDAIYYPTVATLDGVNPYDPAAYRQRYPVEKTFPLYLPATTVVHLPIALLPYRLAELAYFLLTLGLSYVLAHASVAWTARVPTTLAVLVTAICVLASRPGHMNLLLGQVTLQVGLGCYLALANAGRRTGLAAAGVALAAIKPTTGIPLAALLAFGYDDVRATGIGLALATLISLLPLGRLLASNGPTAFLDALQSADRAFRSDRTVDAASSWTRIDGASLLAQVTGTEPGASVEIGLLLLMVGVGAIAIRRILRTQAASGPPLALLLSSTTILACTYHQAYDLLLLTAPMVALAAGELGRAVGPRMRIGLLGLLGLTAANYASTFAVHEALGFGPALWRGIVAVNPAALCVCWASAVYLAFASRASSASHEDTAAATSR